MVLKVPRVGDRVRIVSTHRWKPGRVGRIVEIEERVGARYVVKFERPELGFYREVKGEGEPNLLRLAEVDLEAFPEDDVTIKEWPQR